MELQRFRSVWISDVHLGTRDCKAELLNQFLETADSEYLYLVGDIIDFVSMENSWYWPRSHNAILQKLLNKAEHGTRIVYLPGNHDAVLRQFIGSSLGPIAIAEQVSHQTIDGRRLLTLHGDKFDSLIRHNAILSMIGSNSYEVLQTLDRGLNHLRAMLGFSYWSLSTYLKTNLKHAARYIELFETVAAREGLRYAVDGVVCGHIHKPAIKVINGILYCNDGDWVEDCTSLVEYRDGNLAMVNWAEATGEIRQGRMARA